MQTLRTWRHPIAFAPRASTKCCQGPIHGRQCYNRLGFSQRAGRWLHPPLRRRISCQVDDIVPDSRALPDAAAESGASLRVITPSRASADAIAPLTERQGVEWVSVVDRGEVRVGCNATQAALVTAEASTSVGRWPRIAQTPPTHTVAASESVACQRRFQRWQEATAGASERLQATPRARAVEYTL
jgi:hypothetical protein